MRSQLLTSSGLSLKARVAVALVVVTVVRLFRVRRNRKIFTSQPLLLSRAIRARRRPYTAERLRSPLNSSGRALPSSIIASTSTRSQLPFVRSPLARNRSRFLIKLARRIAFGARTGCAKWRPDGTARRVDFPRPRDNKYSIFASDDPSRFYERDVRCYRVGFNCFSRR